MEQITEFIRETISTMLYNITNKGAPILPTIYNTNPKPVPWWCPLQEIIIHRTGMRRNYH